MLSQTSIRKSFPVTGLHGAAEFDEENNMQQVVRITPLLKISAGKNILNSVMENGIPAKYPCKNETCGYCSAKVLAGTVKMRNNFALTYEEINNDLILMCQSFPYDDEVGIEIA